MLKVKTAAEIFSVSTRTIWRWIKDGKIKSVRVNGLVRIPEEEIQRLKKGE